MPLNIRDESVNDLAEQAQRLLRVIAAEEKRILVLDRLKTFQDKCAELGPDNPDFDQKAFLDEMWGD